MAADSLRFRSVCAEDIDDFPVELWTVSGFNAKTIR